MLRSMYSGVSGMRNFQTKMDVIANNIANVNTTAFKSGRVKFQDMLNQSVASAQGPQGSRGGVNPQQIGLGVKVGSIDTIMEGGAMQPTNRGLDFAIEGEGFFTLDKGGSKVYTRDGAFFADYGGNLINASGLTVMGYLPTATDTATSTKVDGKPAEIKDGTEITYDTKDVTGATPKEARVPLTIPEIINVGTDAAPENLKLQSFNIDGTGTIIGVYSGGRSFSLGKVALTTFSNPSGLTKDGGNNYLSSQNSGEPMHGEAGSDGRGIIQQGFLEMSNVDLANEFTEMIVTSRAYQANSRSITTSDEMIQELLNLKR